MTVPEKFSGRGILSPGEFTIEYELTRELVTRPKTSQHPSIVSCDNTLTIRGSDERPIPEGIYDLILEDGTRERVKNHGVQWTVLSPLPT
jgi:hypothetical protein